MIVAAPHGWPPPPVRRGADERPRAGWPSLVAYGRLTMRQAPLRRNRDFVLLWSGEALSQLGSQASTVAFPLLVLSLTGSPAKAGLVGLAKWLPLAVTALPAGVAADRFDGERLMIWSDAIRALLLASIPVALWVGRPTFIQVASVAFVDGCLFTARYVAERGALAHQDDVFPD